MSYFDEGGTLPPPFNIVPSPKSVWYLCVWTHNRLCGRDHPSPDDPRKHENLKEFTVQHLQTCTVNIEYSVHTLTKFSPGSFLFAVSYQWKTCDCFTTIIALLLYFYTITQLYTFYGILACKCYESLRIVLGLSVSPSCEVTDKALYILVIQRPAAVGRHMLPSNPSSGSKFTGCLPVSWTSLLYQQQSPVIPFHCSTPPHPCLRRGIRVTFTKHNRHMFLGI